MDFVIREKDWICSRFTQRTILGSINRRKSCINEATLQLCRWLARASSCQHLWAHCAITKQAAVHFPWHPMAPPHQRRIWEAFLPGSCTGNQTGIGSGSGTNKHGWLCWAVGPGPANSEEEALEKQQESRKLSREKGERKRKTEH